MVKRFIAQNDTTGDFYLTDDSELQSHGELELTDDEWASYNYATKEYDDWQLHIARQIRENRKLYNVGEHYHTKGDGSWWEYDHNGIELARVCDVCKPYKLRGFVKNYVAEEPIDEE